MKTIVVKLLPDHRFAFKYEIHVELFCQTAQETTGCVQYTLVCCFFFFILSRLNYNEQLGCSGGWRCRGRAARAR